MSGGMNQRVMIAMAIACKPKLLIADEPTTALDVTIQAQILDLLTDLRNETGMGLVLITHDMGVVAETAERVSVQYAGQKVEEQPVGALFAHAASSLYRRPAGRPARTRDGEAAADHSRRRAGAVRPAGGVPVLAALQVRRCQLPVEPPPPQGARSGRARCHYPLNTDERAAS